METWLNDAIPDATVELPGFQLYGVHRVPVLCNKKKEVCVILIKAAADICHIKNMVCQYGGNVSHMQPFLLLNLYLLYCTSWDLYSLGTIIFIFLHWAVLTRHTKNWQTWSQRLKKHIQIL